MGDAAEPEFIGVHAVRHDNRYLRVQFVIPYAYSPVPQAKQRNEIRPLLKLNDELRRLTRSEAQINVTSIVAVGDQVCLGS